jgi:two-component system response regulator PilR (NtrC family)
VKLLRVIQEKAVRAIGEQRETPVDVRILSATHRNLSTLVADGAFREDLYYRINVIEIRVPALRERPEDIPELAEAILRRLARRTKVEPPALEPGALKALSSYAFPGNVRELENILERALALSGGNAVTAGELQLRDAPAGPPLAGVGGGPLGEQLEEIERDAILKALEQTRYNKTAAAKLLGVSFRALRYRIKKLGIE